LAPYESHIFPNLKFFFMSIIWITCTHSEVCSGSTGERNFENSFSAMFPNKESLGMMYKFRRKELWWILWQFLISGAVTVSSLMITYGLKGSSLITRYFTITPWTRLVSSRLVFQLLCTALYWTENWLARCSLFYSALHWTELWPCENLTITFYRHVTCRGSFWLVRWPPLPSSSAERLADQFRRYCKVARRSGEAIFQRSTPATILPLVEDLHDL
jgi:hypothetical protein